MQSETLSFTLLQLPALIDTNFIVSHLIELLCTIHRATLSSTNSHQRMSGLVQICEYRHDICQLSCSVPTEPVRGSSSVRLVRDSRFSTNRPNRANIPFGKHNEHETDPSRVLAPAMKL